MGNFFKKYGNPLVRGGMDLPFFLCTMTLLAFGLVMLLSSSYVYALYNTESGDSLYFFKRQLIFAVFGVVAMLLVSKLNYNYLKNVPWLAPLLLFVSWALLIYCILKPGDEEIKRRIDLGIFSFQPSEIAKLAVIVFCAKGLDMNHKKMLSDKPTVLTFRGESYKVPVRQSTFYLFFYAFIIGITALLVFEGSHLSGAILILLIGVAMLWMGNGKARWFALGLIVVALVVIFAVTNYQQLPIKEYMKERIQAWLDKDFDPLGKRWQINHSLYAIGSGGAFGTGLGNSKQKYLYVSESHTDFIFSIIGEELGFIGCFLLLALFAALIIRGAQIALKSKNRFGALLAFGMIAQLGFQVILNVAVVTDTVPNTGISLPFFSYGGTALMITLAQMGLVLGVSRQANLEKVYTFKRSKSKRSVNKNDASKEN